MPQTSRTAVVITGEVVEASQLEAQERARLPEVLGEASRSVSDLLDAALPLEVEVSDGDRSQFLVTEPHRALRAGLLFRSTLIAFLAPESRQPGDTRMGYRCHLESGQPEGWDLVFRLLDEFVRDWTALQARAVVGALRGWTQEHIGSLWEPAITQPTVANHLQAAHREAVSAAIDLYETRFDHASQEVRSPSV